MMLLSFVVLSSFVVSRRSEAHPISITSATVDVKDRSVAVEIQILLEDLVLYHRLKSGADYRYSVADLNQAAEKHREFLLKYFSVRDTAGNRVTGTITDMDNATLTEGVLQGELMTKSIIYRLEFLMKPRQEFLTFTQTFGGPQAGLPAVMDLMLLQNGILIETPMQLTLGQPYTAKFDWNNPPTRPPKGLAELRRKRAEQLEQRLGIGSYGGLYSFIYVNPAEVRHEILIPLLTFEQWVPIKRRDPEFLEVDEQEAAREEITEFFKSQNPVMLDNVIVKPELTRLNFFSLDINDFALNAEPRRVSVFQARLGVILAYTADRPPSEIGMKWETFNQYATFLRSIVLINDEDPEEYYFRENGQDFKWSGNLDLQGVSAARQIPSNQLRLSVTDRSDILEQLLRNIYGAFDFHDDGEVYDALAASVTGGLLRKLYLQIKRSLLMAEQGGAVSRVTDVKVVSNKMNHGSSADAFQSRCSWRVTGTVEHWGHIHTRENEYEAVLTLNSVNGFWKFSGVEIIGEKRVRFETTLRGYDRD